MMILYMIGLSLLIGHIHSDLMKPEECGNSLGCYSSCHHECEFVITWKDTGTVVDFSLALTLAEGNSDQWIALGLSSDQKMGSDSVTQCVMNGNTVTVSKSYNEGKSNQPLANPSDGLSNTQGSVTDGVLRCSYTQTKTSTNNQIFNLNDDWYLLVPNGVASGGLKNPHSFQDLPSISPEKADFQSFDDLSGEAKPILVKVHGSLMMFAWIFCASIAIVLARFFKPMWPNNELLGERPWFTVHRGLMVTALLCCVTAFIIIFVDVKGWADLAGASNWQRAHPVLGVIVTALVIINPTMALLRPHPDTKYRFIFNWAHWLVGTSSQILSAIAMIMGVTIARSSVPFYCVWILVAWIAYQIFIELFLEMFDCFFAGNRKHHYKDGSVKDPRGSPAKKFIIGLHVIIITGFTVACIVVVAIN